MNPNNKPVYRLLDEGEKLQEGDEKYSTYEIARNEWRTWGETKGIVAIDQIWRRKMESPPRDSETERLLGLADQMATSLRYILVRTSARNIHEANDALEAYQKARHPEPVKPREWWLEIRSNGSVFAHDRAPNFVSLDSRIVHTREIVPSAEDISTPTNPS